jgi:NAD(P)-dependent dehydrogenase (short-subunit alcohol dehydrogenase family)
VAGRTVIITGASDGIGAAAARVLKAAGDTVVLVGRSPQKTAAIGRELRAEHHVTDFSRLEEVRELAATLLEGHQRIDVLANNAGGIMAERQVTTDGFEKTLQVNHLAPFLLTTLLLPRLVENRASVINTSSAAARIFGDIDIDDLGNAKSYTPNKAYGDSKLATILFTRELARRFGDSGISTAAFHPGVVGTSFAKGSTSPMRVMYRMFGRFLLSPEKGADTLLWLASTTPGTDWENGGFYTKRVVDRTHPQADDAALAATLWERSSALVHS